MAATIIENIVAQVRTNAIIEDGVDTDELNMLVASAIDECEKFQHLEPGYYSQDGAVMSASTRLGIVLRATSDYESRTGGDGGFFGGSGSADQTRERVESLWRLDRDWKV